MDDTRYVMQPHSSHLGSRVYDVSLDWAGTVTEVSNDAVVVTWEGSGLTSRYHRVVLRNHVLRKL